MKDEHCARCVPSVRVAGDFSKIPLEGRTLNIRFSDNVKGNLGNVVLCRRCTIDILGDMIDKIPPHKPVVSELEAKCSHSFLCGFDYETYAHAKASVGSLCRDDLLVAIRYLKQLPFTQSNKG